MGGTGVVEFDSGTHSPSQCARPRRDDALINGATVVFDNAAAQSMERPLDFPQRLLPPGRAPSA